MLAASLARAALEKDRKVCNTRSQMSYRHNIIPSELLGCTLMLDIVTCIGDINASTYVIIIILCSLWAIAYTFVQCTFVQPYIIV